MKLKRLFTLALIFSSAGLCSIQAAPAQYTITSNGPNQLDQMTPTGGLATGIITGPTGSAPWNVAVSPLQSLVPGNTYYTNTEPDTSPFAYDFFSVKYSPDLWDNLPASNATAPHVYNGFNSSDNRPEWLNALITDGVIVPQAQFTLTFDGPPAGLQYSSGSFSVAMGNFTHLTGDTVDRANFTRAILSDGSQFMGHTLSVLPGETVTLQYVVIGSENIGDYAWNVWGNVYLDAIPEPSSLALLVGAGALLFRRAVSRRRLAI